MITVRPCQFADLALKSEKDPGVKLKPDGTVDADYFCLATAARIGGFCYLLDLYRAQIPFPEQMKVLSRESKRWHAWRIGIEQSGYQWALGQASIEKGLPCVPVPVQHDKVTNAAMTTPHFENGQVRLRGVLENGTLVAHPALRPFINEALDFPFGSNDDTIDAVCGVVRMCFDDEIQGLQLVASLEKGMSMAIVGGYGNGRDPFDRVRSNF
jgi:phage terminase large subunit-like protein